MTTAVHHSPSAIDRSAPATPQIYDHIRACIVDNRLPPGAKISEVELAASLGISRTPLRAALQQLAAERLIFTRPQVGSVVADLDDGLLHEAVAIRAALEAEVAQKLARGQHDFGPLDSILAVQERAAERDDYKTFFQQDEAFHAALARIAEMPNAWRLVHSVKGHVDRQRYRMMAGIPMRSKRAYREHLNILDRIHAGDPDGAAAAMRAHVTSVLELNGQKE